MPAGKKVLENVNLSFYPDAKIGVLGVNGSGKSTLMRIMAGHRQGIRRRGLCRRGRPRRLPAAGAAARPGARRERQRHARREGQAGDPRPLQRTRHELFRRDRRRNDAAAGRDRGQGPVGSREPGRAGDGRAGLPARRRRRDQAFRRRAPPRRALPAVAREAGTAAARRADQPSRRRDGELARGPFAQLSRRDPHRHPRPLLPRQRDGLDSRARSRPRHPLRGQLFRLAEAKQKRHRAGEDARRRRAQRAIAEESEWIAASPQGASGQVQGAYRALRRARQEAERQGAERRADRHSRRRAARPQCHRLRRSVQRLWRPSC